MESYYACSPIIESLVLLSLCNFQALIERSSKNDDLSGAAGTGLESPRSLELSSHSINNRRSALY